jgi:hypothetical protein
MSTPGLPPKLSDLASQCGADWPTIAKASATAQPERARLAAKLEDADLVPSDTGVVAFGSLARDEWTSGSDLDWTLLVDGQVDGTHAEVARAISGSIVEQEKAPGPTGVFGGLTFSHDIVHFIGGDDDTNTNTTRRILLLLESRSLGDDAVRLRVIRALLGRYVGEDILYHEPKTFLVPRFLLNDYVRYWRTMAVDAAHKRRERPDWALRNIKLRLSRKLIFTAGFWACLSCRLHPSEGLEAARKNDDRDGVGAEMADFLVEFSKKTPLETLADAFTKYEAWSAAKTSFDAYDDFLKILDDPENRKRLKALKVADAPSDSLFSQAKDVASRFQTGLTRLFFDTDKTLTKAAQADGVF